MFVVSGGPSPAAAIAYRWHSCEARLISRRRASVVPANHARAGSASRRQPQRRLIGRPPAPAPEPVGDRRRIGFPRDSARPPAVSRTAIQRKLSVSRPARSPRRMGVGVQLFRSLSRVDLCTSALRRAWAAALLDGAVELPKAGRRPPRGTGHCRFQLWPSDVGLVARAGRDSAPSCAHRREPGCAARWPPGRRSRLWPGSTGCVEQPPVPSATCHGAPFSRGRDRYSLPSAAIMFSSFTEREWFE